jgi:Uma2 family endonuclease
MAMPTLHAAGEWTAEMVRALPDDGKRYEVVDGELLVSPSPVVSHQRAVGRLWRVLDDFCRAHGMGEALFSPSDVEFSPRRMVQPDVFVVPLDDGQYRREWSDIHSLLLAAEVLSPSTARYDRVTKRRMYQSEGVAEYWIVDCDARVIERWRPEDARCEICDGEIVWHAGSHAPTLTIDLAAFFREVHGEG